ncbi:hypothetical protein AJ80_00924 [Polytolypa hystricis UAMH7299]|uniref:DUF6924 domain-containing protein n=1 Tax=Polytolypa hystricis (strain UAMH7299) TaxID=1447883 RepID=A0A2B7Z0J3_POLH7|nr:hypothetical protein AJ80_00924 [Polytolypa hystricis UAMH7299]
MADLIPIICTHAVDPALLSSIIEEAYRESNDTAESLVLLSNATSGATFQDYTAEAYTRAPISPSFKSPFIGWTIEQIATFLKDKAEDTAVEGFYFLVADEQTSKDHTLLFVDTLFNEVENEGDDDEDNDKDDDDEEKRQEGFLTVRLLPKFVNQYSVAIAVGSMGTNELADEADEEGVYREVEGAQPNDGDDDSEWEEASDASDA